MITLNLSDKEIDILVSCLQGATINKDYADELSMYILLERDRNLQNEVQEVENN